MASATAKQSVAVQKVEAIPRGLRKASENSQHYLKDMLADMEARLSQIAPKHLRADKLIKVALLATSRSWHLGECTVNSIAQSLMIAAYLGLECSGILGQGYLVPFWNKHLDIVNESGRRGGYEATFIPGYRGLITLCRNSGGILDVSAQVVFNGDEIEVSYGSNESVHHKPNMQIDRENGSEVIGAYMIAVMAWGNKHPEYMNRSQLQKRRESTKSRDREGNIVGPWKDWEVEMYRKCPIRSGVKHLPFNLEVNAAVELENNLDDGRGNQQVAEMLDLVPKLPNKDGQLPPHKTIVPLNEQISQARAKAGQDDEPQAQPPADEPADDLPPLANGESDLPGQMKIMDAVQNNAVPVDKPMTAEAALNKVNEAESQEPPKAEWDISTWQTTYAEAVKMAQEQEIDPTKLDIAIRQWLVGIKKPRKSAETTADERKALLTLIRDRKLEIPE
jgi:recombination protein RecT